MYIQNKFLKRFIITFTLVTFITTSLSLTSFASVSRLIPKNSDTTDVKTISDSNIDGYQKHKIFISDVIKSSFNFTTIGSTFEYESPNDTKIIVNVKFKSVDDIWSNWVEVDTDEDPELLNTRYFTASSDPSNAFKYKVDLYGNDSAMPKFKKAVWTFINAPELSVDKAPKPKFASNL